MMENKESLDIVQTTELNGQVPASEQEVQNPQAASIDVEAVESQTDHIQTAADYIEYLKQIMAEEQPEKEKVEAIKSAFYKRQKQEIEVAKKLFVEAGNAVENFAMDAYYALETEFKSILNLCSMHKFSPTYTIILYKI